MFLLSSTGGIALSFPGALFGLLRIFPLLLCIHMLLSCSPSSRTYTPDKKNKNIVETGAESGSVEYREGGMHVGGVPGAVVTETADDHEGKIELQKEMLIRQEEEMKRLDREMEDLRRQEYYNQLMKRYDTKEK